MLITNENQLRMLEVLEQELNEAEEAWLVSGYVTVQALEELRMQELGSEKPIHIVIGLSAIEALPGSAAAYLRFLDQRIRRAGGCVVASRQPTHGKFYVFQKKLKTVGYVGSSNLTVHGLFRRPECNVRVSEDTSKELLSLARRLVTESDGLQSLVVVQSATTSSVGSEMGSSRTQEHSALSEYRPLPRLDIPLRTREGSVPQKSGLNWWQGGGRERNPDEAYIPLRRDMLERAKEFFPNEARFGTTFECITDDGVHMKMMLEGRQGNGYAKQITSAGHKAAFGNWILRRKLRLPECTPVTRETLDRYGRDYVTFHKVSENLYYMDFSSPATQGPPPASFQERSQT